MIFSNNANGPVHCNDTLNSNGTVNCNNTVHSGNTEACQVKDNKHAVVNLKNAVIVFSSISLAKEVYQAVAMFRERYFYKLENYWETFVYITSIMYVADFSECEDSGNRAAWQWHVGIISIFFAWINLLFFLKKTDIPLISGIPINLFVRITQKFILNVFVVLAVFVIAFGIVFHCILQQQVGFETLGQSITKTIAMMIGELDYSAIFIEHTPNYFDLGLIFYLAFMFIMGIVMMNIMIGMAVEDVQEIQRSAVAKNTDLKIDFILHFEWRIKWILKKLRGPEKERKDQNYEIINLRKRLDTEGMPIRKIMNILYINDEKPEEKTRLDDIQRDLTKVKANLKQFNTKNNKINYDTSSLLEIMGRLQMYMHILRTNTDSLKAKLESMHTDSDTNTESLLTKMDNLAKMDSLQTNMDSLLTEWHNMQEVSDKNTESLLTKMDSLAKMDSLQTNMDSLLTVLDNMQEVSDKNTESLLTKMDSLAKMDSLQTNMDSLKTELDSMQRASDKNAESLLTKMDSLAKMDSLQTNMDSLKTGLDSMQNVSDKKTESLLTKMDSLRMNTDSLKTESNSMLMNTKSLLKKMDSLQANMAMLQTNIESLKSELYSLQRKSDKNTESVKKMESMRTSQIEIQKYIHEEMRGLQVAMQDLMKNTCMEIRKLQSVTESMQNRTNGLEDSIIRSLRYEAQQYQRDKCSIM